MRSEAGISSNAPDTPIDWSQVRRVLLIRLRSIGDTVLMTPCLAALKDWRPDIEISVVSEPLAAPLLEDHPLVDQLIIARQSVASRAPLIARLRKARFDVAFNMHGGSTGAILARFSGARHSVGYLGQPASWLLRKRAPSPDFILQRSRVHSVEQQLALLNWSGVPSPSPRPQLCLVVSPDARAKVQERLRALRPSWNEGAGSPFACIVPGAAFESKQWTIEGFAAVADHLSERLNLASVVIAGPGQEVLAQQVASATRATTSVMDGLTLKELVALLESARVFVGNDSGPMHIAAALGRPVIAVWGSSNPSVWHPWTETSYRLVDAGNETRDRVGGDPETPPIRRITVSAVTAAIDEVLEPAVDGDPKGGIANRPPRVKIDV